MVDLVVSAPSGNAHQRRKAIRRLAKRIGEIDPAKGIKRYGYGSYRVVDIVPKVAKEKSNG